LEPKNVPLVDLHANSNQIEHTGSRPGDVLVHAVGKDAGKVEEWVDDELDVQGYQARCVEQKGDQRALVFRNPVIVIQPEKVEDVTDREVTRKADEDAFGPHVLLFSKVRFVKSENVPENRLIS